MMRCQISFARLGLALAVLVAAWAGGDAGHAQTLHRFGQSVQPVFEGWNQNPDGSFTMWFGYLNRNYEEEPHVPAGADNGFAPGPPDRGQPTHFYPRRQNFVFGVQVPADWGDKDLVWTLTVNGTTYEALGSLWDTWVLDEGVRRANRGAGLSGRYGGEDLTNQRPRVAIVGDAQVSRHGRRRAWHSPRARATTGWPGPQDRRPRGTYEPLPNDPAHDRRAAHRPPAAGSAGPPTRTWCGCATRTRRAWPSPGCTIGDPDRVTFSPDGDARATRRRAGDHRRAVQRARHLPRSGRPPTTAATSRPPTSRWWWNSSVRGPGRPPRVPSWPAGLDGSAGHFCCTRYSSNPSDQRIAPTTWARNKALPVHSSARWPSDV